MQQDNGQSPQPPTPVFVNTMHELNRVVQIAGTHLAPLVEQAQPTTTLLKALGEELQRAKAKPKSVPHPELVDPDVYWNRALWPQASSVVRSGRKLLADMQAELKVVVSEAETELWRHITRRIAETRSFRSTDPGTTDSAIVDEIAYSCEQLQLIIEGIGVLRPPMEVIELLQSELDDRRRREAIADLKRAGITTTDPHFEQRMSIREADMRASMPWRHQDLAIEAHRQVRQTLSRDVDDLVALCVEPILPMGERIVRRYMEEVSATV